jgi:acyl carrier protein
MLAPAHGLPASSTPFGSRKIDTKRHNRIFRETAPLELDMTREQISDLCVASLANALRIAKDRVKTGTKFSRLGLDSAMVVYVQMELEEKLGFELSPDDFYDYPTVDELSHYLAERRAKRPAA